MTLEKRIAKAIAENTDPFTTDADIRFFETEEWPTNPVTGCPLWIENYANAAKNKFEDDEK